MGTRMSGRNDPLRRSCPGRLLLSFMKRAREVLASQIRNELATMAMACATSAGADEQTFTLHRFSRDGGTPRRISDQPVPSQCYLKVSPDGRWAAVSDDDYRLLLISMENGRVRPVTLGRDDLLFAQGFTKDGDLWLSAVPRASRPEAALLRVDPLSFRVKEERTIRPADASGASAPYDILVSADGKDVAFDFARTLNGFSSCAG